MPTAVLALVCVAWGTIPLVAAELALPPAAIVLARVWIGAAGLGGWLLVARPAGPPLFRHRPGRVVAAGTALALHWTAMFAGYEAAPDGTVAFIVFLAPVGVALLAPRALGEPLGSRTGVALALALGGFALLAAPDLEPATAAGIAWAGVSAALFVAIVLLAKPLAQAYGPLRVTLQQLVVAGVVLLPVAPFLDWGAPRAGWAWLLVLGLAHTALGTLVYFAVLARIPAANVGIIGYLEPVGVVVFSALAGTDVLDPLTVAGGALVVAAGATVLRTRPAPPVEVPAGVPAR